MSSVTFPDSIQPERRTEFDRETINHVLGHCHFIPATRGWGQAFLTSVAPGWAWNEFMRALFAAEVLERVPPDTHFSGLRLRDGIETVTLGR